MSSPIAFREFSEDEYRRFVQTLSDEELIKAGKRLRRLCGDIVLTTRSGFQKRLKYAAKNIGAGIRKASGLSCGSKVRAFPPLAYTTGS